MWFSVKEIISNYIIFVLFLFASPKTNPKRRPAPNYRVAPEQLWPTIVQGKFSIYITTTFKYLKFIFFESLSTCISLRTDYQCLQSRLSRWVFALAKFAFDSAVPSNAKPPGAAAAQTLAPTGVE
jgi:hypothetical protein